MGTLSIEWKHIQEVRSEFFFEVIMSNGQKSYGSIQPGKQSSQLEVVSQNITFETDQIEVVGITPIEKKFFDRMKYSIEAGVDYYSANSTKNISLMTDLKYRTDKYGAAADYSTIFDQRTDPDTESETRTKRNELKTSFQRYFSNNWSAIAILNLLQSEEQNLDIRAQFGGGVTKELLQTNNSILTVLGGAGVNREKYSEESFQTSIEGLSGIGFQTFKFDKPELDISTNLYAFPNFSDWGRIRLGFDVSLRFKLVRDLYFRTSLTNNYDSRPGEGNRKNDLIFQTTFGWTFN